MKRILQAGWILVLIVALVGCTREVSGAGPVAEGKAAREFATGLRDAVKVDAVMGHLTELQKIADEHDGTRAVGTPGYDASVDYVVGVLRDKGFEVETPEFTVRVFDAKDPVLTVGGDAVKANFLQFSAGTPADGVSGPLVAAPAEETPGCVPADYDGLPVKDAVVLVDRGSCHFFEKEAIAAQLGAVALIVADNIDEEKMGGTLGQNADVKIPVVSVSKADGARLREAPATATLVLDATTKEMSARNVIAQTKTGSARDVVMVGGHLDSVAEGPGINDNGTGASAVLETAVQLGSEPTVANAVRFGFWGAEELGIVGSKKYVSSLTVDQLKDIALYLNFDMLGSPNPGYFAYDGDQSIELGEKDTPARVPEGAAGIERTMVDYLSSAGKKAVDAGFDGRSDYLGFTMAGIPSGGLFSGAEGEMSPEQAQMWGGTPNAMFDPNYHKPTDTLDHIDRTALDINGGGVAWAVGVYAQDMGGRNGLPARDDRTRHVLIDR